MSLMCEHVKIKYVLQMWLSGWMEPWGLSMVTDVSTSQVEVVLKVKWRLEIQINVVMLWSALLLVVRMVTGAFQSGLEVKVFWPTAQEKGEK